MRSPAGHLWACVSFDKKFFLILEIHIQYLTLGKFTFKFQLLGSSCHWPNIPSWQESVEAEWPSSSFTILYHLALDPVPPICITGRLVPLGILHIVHPGLPPQKNTYNTDGKIRQRLFFNKAPQICSQESLGKGRDGMLEALGKKSEYSHGTAIIGTP